MSIRKTLTGGTALAVLSLAALGAPAAGQTPTPAPQPQGQQPQIPDSVRTMIQEFQQLQQRLNSLQQQALQQNEELQAEQEALQETVEDAMVQVDSSVEESMTRMEELRTEMQEAREAENQQQMMALSQEAGQLRGRLQSAQSAVMQRPAVQEEIQSFQDNLLDEMIAINPEAEDLVDELETLSQQLQEFQRSQQGPAPAAPPQAAPQGN